MAVPVAGTADTVQTRIEGDTCRQEVDRTDPNETPLRVCPGPTGYALVVRRVDAGRVSADIVDASQRSHPLELQEKATRFMATLDGTAHWRLSTVAGSARPVALILSMAVHEDLSDPAKVTRALLVLSRIDADAACVVDVRPSSDSALAQLSAWSDGASMRPCAGPLPPLVIDGQRVR